MTANNVLSIPLPLNAEYHIWVEGTRRLTAAAEAKVLPALTDQSFKDDLQEAVTGAALRMLPWMQSLSKLDNPADVQAACAACRSLLELRMDLALLKADPAVAAKWKAYFLPRRYKAACQMADLAGKYAALGKEEDEVLVAARAFVDDPVNKKAVEMSAAKHWGGQIPGHWSGKPTQYAVAEHLGLEYERLYRTTYYKMSDHLHPGPCGPLFVDKQEIAGVFSYAHGRAQEFFADAMLLVVDALAIFQDAEGTKRVLSTAKYWAFDQVVQWKEAIHRAAQPPARPSDAAPTT